MIQRLYLFSATKPCSLDVLSWPQCLDGPRVPRLKPFSEDHRILLICALLEVRCRRITTNFQKSCNLLKNKNKYRGTPDTNRSSSKRAPMARAMGTRQRYKYPENIV